MWSTGCGSTPLAYLQVDRDNLVVRGAAVVTRVLFDGERATGVELSTGEQLSAGEVILSAGSIASPHLMLLSGLGTRGELERVGVPVVHELRGVGVGFSDHPQVSAEWHPKVPWLPDGPAMASVSGLRVADTSILPTVPSRGPAATAVLIGERIAHFIEHGS